MEFSSLNPKSRFDVCLQNSLRGPVLVSSVTQHAPVHGGAGRHRPSMQPITPETRPACQRGNTHDLEHKHATAGAGETVYPRLTCVQVEVHAAEILSWLHRLPMKADTTICAASNRGRPGVQQLKKAISFIIIPSAPALISQGGFSLLQGHQWHICYHMANET